MADTLGVTTVVLRWRLAALSVGQVIGWGAMYYALIIASPVIADDTGWPLTAVTLTFSLGLVMSALAGILVGKWLDEHGPRTIMTIGSAVGPVGILIVSAAPNLIVFAVGWVVVGLAQSAVLYQAAFTVVARRYGTASRGALTVLTLAGGLASTLFAPIVAALLSITDWRMMFLVLAFTLLVTTMPLHWFSLERSWEVRPHHGESPHTLGSVLHTRRFWMLLISMAALIAAIFAVTLAVVPLFMEKGMSFELAAFALGMVGLGQVVGRLLYLTTPRNAAPWVPLVITAVLASVSLFLVALIPGPIWLLVALGMLAGAVRGAQTLVQASAVVDRWGAAQYGSINGFFAAPLTMILAFGPALGPFVAENTGSYTAMAIIAAALAACSAVIARFS